MTREALQHRPLETGGLLLGYRSTTREVVITQVLGAGPNAERTAARFVPDHNWQEQQLAAAYERAERRLAYLGDWHSHPRGSTRLSRLDRQTLQTISRHSAARCPVPVMAIIAGADPCQVGIHQPARRWLWGGGVELCQLREFD
jgi:integrative and conjugative element protein (TIGR02256 family)